MARPLKLKWDVTTKDYGYNDRKVEAIALVGENYTIKVTKYTRDDYNLYFLMDHNVLETSSRARLRTALLEAEEYVEDLLKTCLKDFEGSS